jgi:hypothetical protein
MRSEELERQMERFLHSLQEELNGRVERERVAAVTAARFESVRREASINDFIPLLVHRFTREELVAAGGEPRESR